MTRSAPDSCPGVLQLHEAADGPLARVRLPGGRLTPDQLQALAEAAHELGNDALELTSRGNVQLRQVRDAAELAQRLTAAGLLPSPTHERVRNILASPLSGRAGGWTDVHTLVPLLDSGLQDSPALAELPGRVLFTLDDGRGDVSGLGGDIGLHATGADEYALLLGGLDSGMRLPGSDAVTTVLAAAHVFQDLRGQFWRVREVPDGVARITAALPAGITARLVAEPLDLGVRHDIPIGWLDQDNGLVSLGAAVPLATLPSRTAEFVAATGRPLLVTPWRSLVITDLDEDIAEVVAGVLAPLGLIFDATSPWLRVTACAGRPGCAKSHTDVRADVAAAVTTGRVLPAGAETTAGTGLEAGELEVAGRQHWSGCDRRCGLPAGSVTEVTAGPDGYTVTPG